MADTMTSAARRPGFGVAAALLGLLLVSAVATGGWFAMQASKEQRAHDGAAILAEHGLREFAGTTSALAVMDLAIGADSIVTRRRVLTGDETVGMYAVQIERTGLIGFHVKSIGRLIESGAPFVCSFDIDWKLDDEMDPRRALAPKDGPICNGARRRRPAESGAGLLESPGR
ncbi:MAG: hypothetical protein ACRELX_16570 [Longimicrobiales bacterium]